MVELSFFLPRACSILLVSFVFGRGVERNLKKIASECERVTSGVKSAGLSIRNSSGKAETLQILVSIGSFVIIGEDGISLAAASIF